MLYEAQNYFGLPGCQPLDFACCRSYTREIKEYVCVFLVQKITCYEAVLAERPEVQLLKAEDETPQAAVETAVAAEQHAVEKAVILHINIQVCLFQQMLSAGKTSFTAFLPQLVAHQEGYAGG